jgi:hypothetical protein
VSGKQISPLFYVLDRAYIDIAFWDRMRKSNVFMVTRYKENMKPMMKQPVPFDRNDPRNPGVTGCFLLSFSGLGLAWLIDPAPTGLLHRHGRQLPALHSADA